MERETPGRTSNRTHTDSDPTGTFTFTACVSTFVRIKARPPTECIGATVTTLLSVAVLSGIHARPRGPPGRPDARTSLAGDGPSATTYSRFQILLEQPHWPHLAHTPKDEGRARRRVSASCAENDARTQRRVCSRSQRVASERPSPRLFRADSKPPRGRRGHLARLLLTTDPLSSAD
ncbi:hypothetical protein OH77DRAFT_1301419 [Trametes cingulata]|nr:hypothetical protein OH77DRAFT_1301419 [Trametes cingulata]